MKTWNIPSVEELNVMLTASSGVPGTSEAPGYQQDGWNSASYDSSIYEKESNDADCVIKIENSASVES